jgi:hypothetical protein
MGLKKVDYYTIECDNSGCLHSTMDKGWLCPDCKPITKTNRNKNNVTPLSNASLKTMDYAVLRRSS